MLFSRAVLGGVLALAMTLSAQAHGKEDSVFQRELKEAFHSIRHHVGQQWEVPGGVQPTQQATLAIEVAPSGAFKAATVTTSSGDKQFDRSAISAISKALPIPEWRTLSDRTRDHLSRFSLSLGPRGNAPSQQ